MRLVVVLVAFVFCFISSYCFAQGSKAQNGGHQSTATSSSPETLKRDFFSVIRTGDADRFLSYVSQGGLNAGANANHMSRDEVEQQMRHRRGLYCKLFDSSCIQSPINLRDSARVCSYVEALTHSPNARTAATETVRNGVRQAILVAQVDDKDCPNVKLIDFIFNQQSDGWKLFSVP